MIEVSSTYRVLRDHYRDVYKFGVLTGSRPSRLRRSETLCTIQGNLRLNKRLEGVPSRVAVSGFTVGSVSQYKIGKIV